MRSATSAKATRAERSSSLSDGGEALTRADRQRKPILRRRERARPARVVRAGGVIGEVEVEHEPLALATEVGALDRVEQVPARAVRRVAARLVGERDEESAAVPFEPVDAAYRFTRFGRAASWLSGMSTTTGSESSTDARTRAEGS